MNFLLLFPNLDSTFVCPTEIIAFSQKANEFQDVNTQVIGISVDSHFSHLAWINTPRKVSSLLYILKPKIEFADRKTTFLTSC